MLKNILILIGIGIMIVGSAAFAEYKGEENIVLFGERLENVPCAANVIYNNYFNVEF
jgi:hypothetical protein